MEFARIKPKEAMGIIDALEQGVVPQRGIQHLLVGRTHEVEEIINRLRKVAEGGSAIKFWTGDFGSGKSFMLRIAESFALQKNFVVSTANFTPTRRLHASDGKARAMYSEIVSQLRTQTDQDGNAIVSILEQWIEQILEKVAREKYLDLSSLLLPEHHGLVKEEIYQATRAFRTSSLSFALGHVVARYFEGYALREPQLQEYAVHWLKGEYTTKTEANKDLGVKDIITDDTIFNALKNLSELFLAVGYEGFVINLDEMVNLYKLPMTQTRSNNYEVILNIFDECAEGRAHGMFFNFGATRKTIEDGHRGLYSYGALKSRLSSNSAASTTIVDTSGPVVYVKPLKDADIFTLLSKLKSIYEQRYEMETQYGEAEIKKYMEEQLNRPGASEFLTPRAVIRDFLSILSLARQNPSGTFDEFLALQLGGGRKKMQKDSDDHDDEVEVL